MSRKLKQFVVRPEIPGSPIMRAGGHVFMGAKPGDIVTIAGIYEPTRWERFKEWMPRPWRSAFAYRVRFYFSNLWAAIRGVDIYD